MPVRFLHAPHAQPFQYLGRLTRGRPALPIKIVQRIQRHAQLRRQVAHDIGGYLPASFWKTPFVLEEFEQDYEAKPPVAGASS